MYLGIEIGGTKLQLGVGNGRGGELAALVRHDVDACRGAAGILEQIRASAPGLLQSCGVERIGIGFGGPVDSRLGIVTKSHQVAGWDNFPLGRWCLESLGKPAVLVNDCDCAALAEARHGAGRGARIIFYVTVGTGIGGGLVIDGKLQGSGRPASAEIGHLRPGLNADRPEATVESLASGPAIAAAAQARVGGQDIENPFVADLTHRCQSDVARLTAKVVAQAAAEGNEIARQVIVDACQALGWGIAQVVTLVAPQVVVVGGGVSLIGEALFFTPLRAQVQRYVFPPLIGSYQIVPAGLGELAVVHGAIALAASADE